MIRLRLPATIEDGYMLRPVKPENMGVFLSGGFSERRGSSCCILQQSVHVASSRNDL